MNITDEGRRPLRSAFALDARGRLEGIERLIDQLQHASGEGARPGVEALASEAHAIRGGAATVSLDGLAADAAELEAVAGRWVPADAGSLQAVVSSATRLLDQLRVVVDDEDVQILDEAHVARLPRAGEGPVVLHVEDNLSNLKLVERVLDQRPEIRLAEARTGAAGLSLARDLRPSLILLDLRLPDLSGEEVLRLIRSGETTREIGVVVISAEARTVESDRLLAAGADDYLVKPIDIGTLLEVVDRLLARAAS